MWFMRTWTFAIQVEMACCKCCRALHQNMAHWPSQCDLALIRSASHVARSVAVVRVFQTSLCGAAIFSGLAAAALSQGHAGQIHLSARALATQLNSQTLTIPPTASLLTRRTLRCIRIDCGKSMMQHLAHRVMAATSSAISRTTTI
jgi:hypothetical protein